MLLEVRDLQVNYGNIQALHGISFSVDEGEIVTLIGANGAGKSTILMTISRQIPHVAELGGKVTGGSIMYQDEDLLQYEPHQVVSKFGISQVPEGRRIFGNLSVLENLKLATYARKDKVQVQKDYKRVFDIFPRLEERKHQRGETLSGGEQQMLAIARAVKKAGARALRGGAFKPRTSPYSFQGLKEDGLKILAEARDETGLAVVTEVLSASDVELVAGYADVLQIGARNMQNYALLHAVGEAQRPVLLKRGMMSTIEELLMAAEYILSHGNDRIILCERGIRTFEKYTRNTLDISAVPLLKQLSHLPVVVDPSHATGSRELVEPVSQAAVAAGADGLLIEVHPHPEEALSDGAQSLEPDRFARLMRRLQPVAEAVGRTL